MGVYNTTVYAFLPAVFDAVVAQLGDLLADEAQHEEEHGRDEKKRRHVGEAVGREIGVGIVGQTHQKKGAAHGKKDAKGRKERRDLQDDEKKPNAVPQGLDLALAFPLFGLDGHVTHRTAAA